MTSTIWEKVKSALTPLNVPMDEGTYKLGSGDTDYPDTYLVYFMFSMDPELFANDEEKFRSEAVQVSVYKRVSLVGMPDVIGAMKTGGFTFIGGRELEYDNETRHYVIAFDFEYYEQL